MRRGRSMWGGMEAACIVLAILLAGMIVAIAELGAAAPEAGAEGLSRPWPVPDCRWELVELGGEGAVRGILESWPAQAPAPLVLLDQCSGETWLFGRGPSGAEWREVPRR